MSAPIVTALAAVEMKSRRHDEKAGPWIEVSEFSALARGIVGVHDLRIVRLLGCEALGVRPEATRFVLPIGASAPPPPRDRHASRA